MSTLAMARSVVAALVLASVCSTLEAQTPAADPWVGVNLVPAGWTELGRNTAQRGYYRLPVLQGPEANPMIWMRFEDSGQGFAQTGYKSEVELLAFDCRVGRVMTVQKSTYPENNLSGTAAPVATGIGAWSYIIPDSFVDKMRPIACK